METIHIKISCVGKGRDARGVRGCELFVAAFESSALEWEYFLQTILHSTIGTESYLKITVSNYEHSMCTPKKELISQVCN